MLWLADPELTNITQTYGICTHKWLFKPFSWRDILTALILFVGSCVAAGAGVGGGGLNVPMLVFIDGFPASKAIPLSSVRLNNLLQDAFTVLSSLTPYSSRLKVMIGGAAIANFVHALPRQRLTAPRPLIDYHTTLLLTPLTMGGSVIGILLNRLLPDWLILAILIVTLCYSLYTTGIKFIKTWKADHAKNSSPPPIQRVSLDSKEDQESDPHSESSTVGIELENVHLDENEHEDADSANAVERDNESKRTALELQEQQIPRYKLLACLGILILITLHSIFLGGKGGPSVVGIKTCSATYWVLMVLLFPVLFGITWYIAGQLVKLYHFKRLCGFQFLNSDIEWTEKRTYITMAVATGAGCLSSLLGVGGGMLINPLLLEMGVAPDCTAATSSLMILFTSISAVAQYGIIGRIQWDYAAFLFILGLLGSIVGQHALGVIVKKYKSQSYILLAMLLIIVPGGILLTITALTDLVSAIKAGSGVGFKQLCSA